MQPEPLDLSSLDPTLNQARWEETIRTVTERAEAGYRSPLLSQLSAWARPALALAVAATLVAWAPALLFRSTAAGIERQADPARTLSEWAASPHSTATGELLSSLGGANEL